ncbi:imm11 family protein [Paenibacillus caui]|uniref:imm11 family protein n=1 Tax=Paenibacillus caui TaxID=2873927 RepID=UPI001CA9527B|nr:DUF1629 domain-containing protein [Paenibacillus caui]
MKVYELRNNFKSTILRAVDDRDHPICGDFNGESKKHIWTPVKVETLYKKTYMDFPKLIYGKPIVSYQVKSILETYVSNEVEFLPLAHQELDLYLMNVINVLDCVDWERSDVQLTSKKHFAGFNNLVFDFSKIPLNTYVFKFKELAEVRTFVTESFKNLIERNKLKGLDFSVVYDSEFTEKKELEQKRAYEAALAAIENNKRLEISYEEARERVDHGAAMASGKWKMQLDEQGRFGLGELLPDLTYQWIRPIYIPPILLGYRWHEVEKSEISNSYG